MDEQEMDNSGWVGVWTSSESEDESVYSDDSLGLCPKMETVHAGGGCFLLPEEMCDKPSIFKEILSMDTWRSFSEEQRQHLKNFLPDFPENDSAEKESCIEMLFSGNSMRFGNPLLEFHNNLKAGYYRPDISRMRSLLRKTRYKDYKRREKWRMFKLVKSILVSRSRLADAVVNGEKISPTSMGSSHLNAVTAADRRTKNHEARVKTRYLQELQLIKESIGDSEHSSDDEVDSSIPAYSQILKRNRRKEFQSSGTCVLGTLSPGPNPWDISKYPSANPYQPNQLTYNQLLKTHYNRKNHKKYHPGMLTDDITLEEVAQRCKLLKRPPINMKTLFSKKPQKIKSEELDGLDESNGLMSLSSSMGGVQASPLHSSPLMESISASAIPQEADDDSERVDIEAVDDMTDMKSSFNNMFNTLLGSKPANRTNSNVTCLNRKPKSESPVDFASRKLTLESMLDEPVTHPIGHLMNHGAGLTPTPAKRPRAESSDSHFRNLTQPHCAGRQIKEIPALPKKPEHKRSQSLTEGKTTSSVKAVNTKLSCADLKSGRPVESLTKTSKSTDDIRATIKSNEELISLPSFKKIKTEPLDEHHPLPSFKKLKSELPDKSTQPLPSFKKLKSGEIVEDFITLPSFKKIKSETVEELLPLPSFKKLKSGENVDELLPLPSFKKLKSETAEYHARAKLAKEGMLPSSPSISLPSSPGLSLSSSPALSMSSSSLAHPQSPATVSVQQSVASNLPQTSSGINLPISSVASSAPPPPLKVEPLDPPPQTLPSFNIVQPMKSSSRLMTPATLSDLDGIDMMALPVDFDTETSLDDLKGKIELKEETQACFFSLIRDVVTSTEDHRMDLVELEARLKTWASSPIAPLNHWYTPDIEKQLLSALFFLTGESHDIVPEDYVPYMEYKVNCNAYQWIGAGRDSDHRLVPLCNLWSERAHATPTQPRPALLVHRPIGFRVDGAGMKEVVLARPGRSNESTNEVPHARGPAVQPSSPRDRQIFRIQEKQRYESPQRSYTYRVGNIEAVLGPVRNVNSLPASKARGHTLLVTTRPKCVSILELVRDAVARLPGGQGTRADIVTLLKDSQYLVEDSVDSVLSSVVSGALDKLHSEEDPSVRYDPKRKIWVYLHAQRSAEEFERLHALGLENKPQKPKPSRKSSKKKETQPKDASTGLDSSLPQSAAVAPPQTLDKISESIENRSNVKTAVTKPSSVDTNTDRSINLLNKKTSISTVNAGIPSSESTTQQQMRPVADAATTTVKNTSVKKFTSSVSAGSSPSDKQAKSIVKVITGAQAGSSSSVRSLSKQTISAQQVLQLKQQLLGEGKKVLSQSSGQQTSSGQTIQPQQQVIVMKGGDQQQMIVISGGSNQQHFVVEQGVLTAKQHKQIQQLLSKPQEHTQESSNTSTGQHRQTSAIALQQQLQQLILAKQQQMLAEQNKAGNQQPGGQNKVTPTSQQMILVKQGSTENDSGVSGPNKVNTTSQQMILVKGSSEGESVSTGSSKVGSNSQQMILVKGTEAESTPSVQTKVGTSSQQMILVKGSAEGESAGQTLQQMILVSKGGSTQSTTSTSSGSATDLILFKQQQQQTVDQQASTVGVNTSTAQQIILKQQQATSSQGQQTDVQQISQQQLQQILLKQQNQSDVSSHIQQLLIKQLEGPAQQLQHLLIKQPGGQTESVQQISQQQLQQLLMKQQQGSATSQNEVQQIVIKQSGVNQSSGQSQSEVVTSQHQQQVSQQQLQQLLVKQSQSESGQVQQLVMKQNSGQGESQQVQLLVKQQGGQTDVQHISQQQLQQLLIKQQQQMIIVKQHDQKHIQVIPQGKSQSLTLAQIQQLQQQQLQQKSTVTTSLLNSPRVVTSLGGTSASKGQTSQMVAKVQGSVVSMETILAAQHKQGLQSTAVNRTSLGQYAVVSVPQQRMSVSEGVVKQSVAGSSSVSGSSNVTSSVSGTSSPRLPISVAQISGKQLLLTGKPTTQNVLLGTTSSGQAVLLHQGSQQILIPSQTLKAIQGLKVIPITGSSVPSSHRTNAQGLRAQGQQVFARLVAPSTRPMVVQQSTSQQPSDPQQPSQQPPND